MSSRRIFHILIGLDVMDKYSMQVLSVSNELECVTEGWRTPLSRKHGLIYWEWSNEMPTFFTRPQLERLHRHLLHPSTRKLYNLLRRAKPDQLTPETMETLNEIQKTCQTCQMYAPKQFVFRIRHADDIRFNHELRQDISYLDSTQKTKGRTAKQRPVLHIVDVGTKFQNAAFPPSLDTTTIWNTFVKIWTAMYVGFPERMLTDQGSVFVSKEWEYNCELAKIELKHTGTESHNSLGSDETYHALMRRVYCKTRAEHPTVPEDVSLALTVKAINSTVGPDGLCPQLLVFGILPRPPGISPNELPAQKERFRALRTARDEYEKLVSKELVNRGLRSIPPPAADHKYMPGDFVHVYREKIKRYTGPHIAASVHGKQVRLHVRETTVPREFNIAQLRPAPLTRLPSMDEVLTNENAGTPRVLYTEEIHHGDPRESLFDDAKRQEIAGLIEKGTFRLVLEEETGPNPNIVPCRFFLCLKHSETGEVKYKARFVLGGHRDKDKNFVVHNTTNIKASSVRLIMALATILGFDVWSLDVRQAYLQSASELRRNVFVRPKEMDLLPGELLQIIRPLHGLSDSGDYWCETFSKFHIHNLRMQQSTGDFALFFRRCADSLMALSGSYVDDIIQASPTAFKDEIQKQIQKHFDIKLSDTSQFVYTGIMCDTSNQDLRTLSQAHYIKRLQCLPADADFQAFRSLPAKLMWTVHTRPDIACAAAMSSQVTTDKFSHESVYLLNLVVRHLKRTAEMTPKFPKLDQDNLHLVVYTDSSFANTPDYKSQLGFIICVADASQKCSILHFSSHKSHRVARSSMAAETLAFVDWFDNAFPIKHDLERIIGRRTPLLMMTDSKLLFDVLTRARYTTERRLDIASAREAYLGGVISNVGLIQSAHNPADGLTKIQCNDSLQHLLRLHKLDHPVEQYVIHPSETSGSDSRTSKRGSVKEADKSLKSLL